MVQALGHAAAIISSLLPGCADPPSPPKSARVYRPGFVEALHGPSDGVKPPSPIAPPYNPTGDHTPHMHTGLSSFSVPCLKSSNPAIYPENSVAFANHGPGERAVHAMHAAHTAYLASEKSSYGVSNQAVQGMGLGMHNTIGGGESIWKIDAPQQWDGLLRSLPSCQRNSGW
jgi:hypothetical protein